MTNKDTGIYALDRDVSKSDGSTAEYYKLPDYAKEIQHLINHKNMNANIGEIFRTSYRYGFASHSDQMRDAKNTRCITCNQSTNENEIYREAGRKESLINKFMKARIND